MRVPAVLACVLMAGCLVTPFGAVYVEPVLVLRYTLYNEDEERFRSADPGPHCATATFKDETARIERGAFADQGRGRDGLLIVLPRLERGWGSTGSAGYPLALPAEVSTGIPGEDRLVASITWDGKARLNGERIDLPHTWTVQGDGWRAEAHLEQGPSQVKTFRADPCA